MLDKLLNSLKRHTSIGKDLKETVIPVLMKKHGCERHEVLTAVMGMSFSMIVAGGDKKEIDAVVGATNEMYRQYKREISE